MLWHNMPEYQNDTNSNQIESLREKIQNKLTANKCLSTDNLKKQWNDTFRDAKQQVIQKTDNKFNIHEPTWEEVFQKSYSCAE